jgi:hypothetical protein
MLHALLLLPMAGPGTTARVVQIIRISRADSASFSGGARIFVSLRSMRSKRCPVRLVPMLSLSVLSGRSGVNILIGPYFGTAAILSGSLSVTKSSTTTPAVIPDWPEPPRLIGAAFPPRLVHNLSPIPGGPIARVYFRPQSPPELEFATDR